MENSQLRGGGTRGRRSPFFRQSHFGSFLAHWGSSFFRFFLFFLFFCTTKMLVDNSTSSHNFERVGEYNFMGQILIQYQKVAYILLQTIGECPLSKKLFVAKFLVAQ
jgi:hypothetical protein